MIRWCANCQRYIGERPPFESFAMTHGICKRCRGVGLDISTADLSHINEKKKLLAALSALAANGEGERLAAAVLRSRDALNLGPVDLFFGIIQPMLYAVGDAWAHHKLSVADEHKVTAICSSLLRDLEAEFLKLRAKLDTLLVCGRGNDHVLGVRALALALNSRGIQTEAVYPDVPVDDILRHLQEKEPAVLGISVSMAEQRREVEQLLEQVGQLPLKHRVTTIIGGSGVNLEPAAWKGLSVDYFAPHDIDDLVDLIAQKIPGKAILA